MTDTTPFTEFAFPATGAPTSRTSPDRWSDIINVKDFGAKGDGVTDDRAALQAAFDAAWGPAASSHGNTFAVNTPVFLPRGNYKVSDYLTITGAWGGRIYGAGPQQTTITTYTGQQPSVAFEGWRPILWLNGCNYFQIDNLHFSTQRDSTTVALTSITNASPAVFTKAAHGLGDGEIVTLSTTGTLPSPLIPATAPQPTVYYVTNVTVNTFQLAYIAGGTPINTASAGSGTHSYIKHKTVCVWFGPDGANGGTSAHGNIIMNCQTFNSNYGYIHGSAPSGANSENTYIGCYASYHDVGLLISGANTLNIRWIGGGMDFCDVVGIKSNNSACIAAIAAMATSGNFLDFDIAASDSVSIIGTRSECWKCIRTNTAVFASSFSQSTVSGSVTATVSGQVMTVSAVIGGFLAIGMVVEGSGITAGTVILGQISGTRASTGTYLLSTSNTVASPTTIKMYIVFGYPAKLLTFCSSQVHDYDMAGQGVYVVAGLPAPKAGLKGLSMFVTDSTVAASGNFAAIVAGGSNNAVPVFCDGTNWRIG
jgi:enamine deaminase RidA (YjgF/YER057c/UK114 family)